MAEPTQAQKDKAMAEIDHGTPDECEHVHKGQPHDEWYAQTTQYMREAGLLRK